MRSPQSPTPCSVTDAVLRPRASRSAARHSLLILAIALGACAGEGNAPPPPAPPSLTLTLSAPAVTLRAGDDAILQVVLTRANMSQDVRLTISDLPPGMVGAFTDPVLPAGSVASSLLLNASRETAPGVYTTIVTASAQGVNAQALPLTITVTPAPTIVVTAKPESVSIISGGSASITLDIERTNYTDGVFFELEDAPPGLTASFPDSPTTGSLATVNFAATSEVLPGVYLVVIQASAPELPVVRTSVQLTVLPPLIAGFDVFIHPESLRIRQGSADTVTVTINRENYEDDVTLFAVGLPDGVIATFQPSTTRGSAATATIIVNASTLPGSYSVTILASGEGAATTGANLQLVIEEMPALALLSIPESLTVTVGDSLARIIALQRTNLPDPVQLGVTGAPAGVDVRFDPNPTKDDAATLRIAVDASAPPGSYTLTIHAAAAGIAPIDVSLTLTIAAPGG